MRRLHLAGLLASPGELADLRYTLASGGVAAVPTETFYALAADPMVERGVARVFEIKQRDDGKPLLVLFSSRAQLEELGVSAGEPLLARFLAIWPAPLTAVLPLRAPIAASRGALRLAVRMPASAPVRSLLDALGPLTGTSANRSGAPALSDPDGVAAALGEEIDVLVDGGATPGGEPSTLVDATCTPPALLRAGAFPWPPNGPAGA